MLSRALVMFALSLAACGSRGRGREITVEQYAEVALPGIAGVNVHVSDISVGAVALITIKRAADGFVIAKGNLRERDEMPFVLRESGPHVLTVVDFDDRLVADEATLRIEDRRTSSKHVVLLPIGTIAVPSTPDIKLTLDELEPPRVRIGVSTPTSGTNGTRWLSLGEPLGFELHAVPYEVEPLSFDGPAVYVRVAPRRRR
jgi:hypothetical protein